MGPIEDLGRAIGQIAETAGRSTVGVGNRWRGGSGVVIEQGKVLTNAHNLHGDEVRLQQHALGVAHLQLHGARDLLQLAADAARVQAVHQARKLHRDRRTADARTARVG